MSTDPTTSTTDPPADVAAAIDASDYPGEAAERLAAARGIAFPEAFRLIQKWQVRVLWNQTATATQFTVTPGSRVRLSETALDAGFRIGRGHGPIGTVIGFSVDGRNAAVVWDGGRSSSLYHPQYLAPTEGERADG